VITYKTLRGIYTSDYPVYKVAVASQNDLERREYLIKIGLLSDFKLTCKLALNIAYLGPVL
jgi:hypothetical protein